MALKSFYIIDGSAYIFRGYYAIRDLSTASGLPTNAVYGFIKMLLKIIAENAPDYLAIAFDTKGPTFRHEVYPEYKAHRPEMPDDLAVQIPYIHQAVSALGIVSILKEGYEADDLIGTLAKSGEAQGVSVTIVSGDKDMFQLVSPQITVYDPVKEKRFTPEDVHARFGVPPSHVVDIMGLMGDTADNIPGVSGIGQKTAMELIAQFGTMDHLLSNLDQVKKPKLRDALQKEQEMARLSRALATIRTDCPIDFHLDHYHIQQPNPDLLLPLLKELEFTSLLKEFSTIKMPEKQAHRYQAITASELSKQIAQMGKIQQVVIEIGSIEHSRSVGIALAFKTGDPLYLSVDPSAIPAPLRNILESNDISKTGHDLKPLLAFFKKQGVTLSGPLFDTMIAAYLLNPGRRDYALKTLAQEYLKQEIDETTMEGECAGLCQRASVIFQLTEPLTLLLHKNSLSALLAHIEIPLIAVLAEIEQVGIKIDLSLLSKMSHAFDQEFSEVTKRAYAHAGREFNINSPKQLAEILFQELHLPPVRKTKTGFSTDEDVLSQLAPLHPLPAEIIKSRQIVKLKSTYIDALPQLVSPSDGRVHTKLNQAVAATGRLSSSDPNLQNIPIRGEWGQKIREAFIAEEGCLLLVLDYNQIELRILAHLSEDTELVNAFQTGEDIHTRTAAEIFGLPKEAITREMRRAAKSINFGIIYGMSPFGLATQLGIPQTEAKRYIDLYFAHYHGVRRFIDETLTRVRETGIVKTLFQRKRTIVELTSRNNRIREMGERLAINTPIQGSAADIIKLAMIEISAWLKEAGMKSRLILQVHDELLLEVPEAEMPVVREKVASLMEEVVSLKVPLKVDVGVGANWWAAKP